ASTSRDRSCRERVLRLSLAIGLHLDGDDFGMMRQPIDQGEGVVGCDMALPCIEMLAATPEILRGLMCELSDEDARWKPASDRFSVAEVLAYLSHSDGHCDCVRLGWIMGLGWPVIELDGAR